MRIRNKRLEGGDRLIQVYTGEGKGKTTAALGIALRAAGAGLKVYIAQFAKGTKCSEHNILNRISEIKVEQFGSCRFIRKPTSRDVKLARAGFKKVEKVILKKKYSVIILDEIIAALNLKLIDLQCLISLLKSAPSNIEIILTGRQAPSGILKIADLVSEIKEIKHYYRKGVKARKGIEF